MVTCSLWLLVSADYIIGSALNLIFSLGLIMKMTKADFIRNNRGIDDGKDLPEEYLGDLYDQIVRNEIKMKADLSVPQSKQSK